jgi:hypothetical protein
MSFRQKRTVSVTHVVTCNRQRLWKTSVGRAAGIQSTTDILDSIATSDRERTIERLVGLARGCEHGHDVDDWAG